MRLPPLPREETTLGHITLDDWTDSTVTVRGLTGAERLHFIGQQAGDAQGAAKYASVSELLAITVLQGKAPGGQPVATAQEWDEYGGQYLEEWLRLFEIARRLSGLDVEDAKKK